METGEHQLATALALVAAAVGAMGVMVVMMVQGASESLELEEPGEIHMAKTNMGVQVSSEAGAVVVQQL